jgi:PAS domain S-box-containing protein
MTTAKVDYQNLIDGLNIGVFRSTIGSHAKFVFINKFLRDLLGLTGQNIESLSVADFFTEERKLQLFYRKAHQENKINKFEVRLKGHGKKSFTCFLSGHVVCEQDGKPKWLDVVVDDISDQKRYEKDLIESKEMFQTVFNNMAATITVTDKDERIVAWNPFAEKMLRMTREELFNKPVKDLYPAKEWKRLRALNIRQKGVAQDIETQVLRSDGHILDVSISISVLKDLEGNPIGSIGIIRDITVQKAAERKLRESENKIRIILDNSAAAITLTDDEERIVSWNKYTEHLLEMKKTDLYLKPVSAIYPKAEWDKIRSENIRKTGSKHHLQTKIMTSTGKLIDIDLSINILRDLNGEIVGSVGIMQDITEQKKFQEMLVQAKLAAEEANSAKSLFLANMSHEVRTPMNTIMGMIDLTLDTPLTDDQKENLSVAKDAADNLLGLLNDILDLSRVEAGKITLEQIDFHLHHVAKSVIKGLSVLAHNRNLQLELHIDPNVPELLQGDPVRLRQVMINLINNAIKFTHKGKIITHIKVSNIEGKDAALLFSITDQGIGIPKDKHEVIFDLFTQADESTTRRFGGTGLGLAICKRLVEMMSGRIWVESELTKGSTFFFTAQFKIVEQGKTSFAHLQEDGKDSGDGALKDLNILLAEDNVVNQKIVIRMLEKHGWQVETAVNGQEVIEQSHKKDYDIILMDAHMPVIDGLEATRIIRRHEEKTGKHVPIIALTARAMQEDRRRCLDAGMDGYVAKPIDRKKLYDEITSIFKKGKSHE